MTKFIKENMDKIALFISTFFLCMMALYFFFIVRYRPWIGDDVLHNFTGGLSYYIYPERATDQQYLGEKFHNIYQLIQHATEYYLNWGGRILTGIADPLMVMAGKTFSAIITVITFIGILIAGLRLVYKNVRTILLHPLSVIAVGALLLFYNVTLDYGIMRCMVNLYGFSLLLYLILFNLNEEIFSAHKKVSQSMMLMMNIVGFLAGISHELLGIWFIFQLLFRTIICTKNLKNFFIHYKCYMGLFMGYIICFIAPGNFARMKNPHEAEMNSSYFPRVIKSAKEHLLVMTSYEGIGKYIFQVMLLLTLVSFIFLIYKKRCMCIHGVLEKIISILVSVALWGIVARTPSRGLYGVLLYALLIMIEINYNAEKLFTYHMIISMCISIVIFFVVLYDNCSWIPSMTIQAKNRENIINTAVADSEKEVYVPKFTEECNRSIMLLEYVDSQYELDWFYYIRMYGTHIIIQ